LHAYAILDGGGVKGAALAGCPNAAEEDGVTFAGYGGTSAGRILALLASVGYTPDKLYRIMTEQIDFTAFLDDHGAELDGLQQAHSGSHAMRDWIGLLWRNWRLLLAIVVDLGLYHGQNITCSV
jgi:NTE family protein